MHEGARVGPEVVMMTKTEELAAVIVTAVRAVFTPLRSELKALQAEIKELQARPTMSYRGVWDATTQYNPGQCVTSGGSIWHCNCSTRAKTGDSTGDWSLACKRGRDGKDLR